jgi:hypothetical protein
MSSLEEKLRLVEFRSFNKELQHCSNAILSAEKYIRKMKGGSQSILVQANDGRYYVVKMIGNPQGPNVLANERLGNFIAKSIGLPTAEGKGIYLSDSFIDSHPDLWFELASGGLRPNKGVHYGSTFVGQPCGPERPSEYISPSRVNMITNRDSFLGMYLLDVWANHRDSRQAVLLRASADCTQKAFFIDHGHMFGGPKWNFQESPGSALHLEKAIYSDLLPSEWYSGDLRELIGVLNDRLPRLPELVQTDVAKFWQHPRQESKENAAQLLNSGISNLRNSDARSSSHRGSTSVCA